MNRECHTPTHQSSSGNAEALLLTTSTGKKQMVETFSALNKEAEKKQQQYRRENVRIQKVPVKWFTETVRSERQVFSYLNRVRLIDAHTY
eukprot:gene7100-5033_t